MKTIIDIVIIEVLIVMNDAKIFISHCANDSEIGEKFLDFLLSLGYKKENIFYSSKRRRDRKEFSKCSKR